MPGGDLFFENEDVSTAYAFNSFLKSVQSVRKVPFELPKTVSLIECPNGTKIYLIGTAHFSRESIEDVKFVMERTLPDFLVVELCDSRKSSIFLTETEIQRLISENSLLSFVKNLGVSNGIVEYLLLRLSSYIMKQVGMAPGGEFRAAVQMLSHQVHHHLILGDRPIGITLQRAMDSLGIWKNIKFFFSLLFGFVEISPEEIEALKKEDLIEQLVNSLTSEYPELTRAILEERDLYLARSIWEVCGLSLEADDQGTDLTAHEKPSEDADSEEDEVKLVRQRKEEIPVKKPSSALMSCCPIWPSMGVLPRVIVAVVGIGHVAGIKKAWSHASSIDKKELCKIKPKSRSWILFRWASRALLLTVFGFATYFISCSTFRISRYVVRGSVNFCSKYFLS